MNKILSKYRKQNNGIAVDCIDIKETLKKDYNMDSAQIRAFLRIVAQEKITKNNLAVILGLFNPAEDCSFSKQIEYVIISLEESGALYHYGIRNQLATLLQIEYAFIDKCVTKFAKKFERGTRKGKTREQIKKEYFAGTKFTFRFENCSVHITNK